MGSRNKLEKEEADMFRKREDSLPATNRPQREREKQRLALQKKLQAINSDIISIQATKLPWRTTFLRLLSDARREKGEDEPVCRWLGKCENCWLQCNDANKDGFNSTGCKKTECSCVCHRTAETNLNWTDSVEDAEGYQQLHDRIEKSLEDIERDMDHKTDPKRYLTRKEKLETLQEFGRGMSWVNTKFCAMICDKWVRFTFCVALFKSVGLYS